MEKSHTKLILITIITLLLLVLVYAYDIGGTKSIVRKLGIGSISQLDLIKNPKDYIGERINVKFVLLSTCGTLSDYLTAQPKYEPFDTCIVTREVDGTPIYLKYTYYRDDHCSQKRADLIGEIEIDDKGYYLNVTRLVCRKVV